MAMQNPTNITFSESGDSVFENIYVTGKLNYEFNKEDITFNTLNVSGKSTLGDVTVNNFNVSTDAKVTGITTVSELDVTGKLNDAGGSAGSSGQILSSTGAGIDWIDANTTSVANSVNVGVNVDATNAEQWVSFFGSDSGNQPNRVDAGLKYNPSTNRLTAGSYAGDGSALTGIVSIPAGVIVMWSGAEADIPSGWVLCDGTTTGVPDLRNRFIIGAGTGSNYSVDDTGGSADATLVSHSHTTNSTSKTLTGYFGNDPHGSLNQHTSGIFSESNSSFNEDSDQGNSGRRVTIDATHTHGTDSQGSSASNANLPPYYALCYIYKT